MFDWGDVVGGLGRVLNLDVVAVSILVRVGVPDGLDGVAIAGRDRLGTEVVREVLDAGEAPVTLDIPVLDFVVAVDGVRDRRRVRPVPELCATEVSLAGSRFVDIADSRGQAHARMRIVLFGGDRRLPRREVAVAVDARPAQIPELGRVDGVDSVLRVRFPLAVAGPRDRRPHDVPRAVLVVREQIPLGAVLVRRDELVAVRVVAGSAVGRPREVLCRDVLSVRCLGNPPLFRAAVDRVAFLNQILEFGGGGARVVLLVALGWRGLVKVVVVAVELEVEAAVIADTGFVPRCGVVPARVLDAVEERAVFEDERAGHLGAERRCREPLEIADNSGGVRCQRVLRIGLPTVPVFLRCGEASSPGADRGGDGCFHQGTS